MPIRLAIFQRNGQPLNGLCTQLQCAGHEILSCYTLPALLGSTDRQDIDIVMIDAQSNEAKSTLEGVERHPSLHHVPVMLIAADDENAIACSSWSKRVDDIIVLPVRPADLKGRVRSLSRLASMTAEYRRRRDALADFGIAPPADALIFAESHGVDVLIVGPVDERQIEVLGVFDGRIKATYAIGPADAVAQLGHAQFDVIMVTSALSPDDFQALLCEVKSMPEWSDLPIFAIADTLARPSLEMVRPWDEVEFLSPSAHSAITRIRLENLIRQWRLRRQLRGCMIDRLPVSVMDGLTGLYGHSFLHHYLDSLIIDHRRRGTSLAVAICTLAGLSEINETWGYPEGDRVLLNIALKMAVSCRAQDLVARIGGCQFAVLLSDTPACEAVTVCHRLNKIVDTTLSRFSDRRRSGIQIVFSISEMKESDVASTLVTRASRQRLHPRASTGRPDDSIGWLKPAAHHHYS